MKGVNGKGGKGLPARCIGAVALGLLLAGCTSPRIEHNLRDKPIGQSYQPTNVYAVDSLPVGFRRVLVLPPEGPGGEELSPELADALITSLRTIAPFEIVQAGRERVSRIDGGSQLSFGANRPLSGALLDLAGEFGVDGLLELQFTHYRPYKPMQIALKGRLVELTEGGRILWEVDEVFDAGFEPVATGARKYAEERLEQAFPLQSSYSILMSPVRFAGYVGYTVFATLPSREAP